MPNLETQNSIFFFYILCLSLIFLLNNSAATVWLLFPSLSVHFYLTSTLQNLCPFHIGISSCQCCLLLNIITCITLQLHSIPQCLTHLLLYYSFPFSDLVMWTPATEYLINHSCCKSKCLSNWLFRFGIMGYIVHCRGCWN